VKEWDCILLTEGQYLNPGKMDDYVKNVLSEQELVQNALEAKGLKVKKVDWADAKFDWSTTRSVLVREIWDYFHRFAEFSTWLEAAIQQTNFINPSSLIRWSLDKHYLNDLENLGVNVCSSRFIEVGEKTTLGQIQEEEGLKEFVLKPAISGAARHTYRLDLENLVQHEGIFQNLISEEAMMIQPFQRNILTKGEVAYMVFGGTYSHAILKTAKDGDFRVQDDFGGTVQLYDPTGEEIAFVEDVVAKTDPLPVYARVDVIWDNDDRLAVAELELIEPELWLRFRHEAAGLFAEAVLTFIGSTE